MCRTPGIGYGAKAIDCYDVEEKKKIFLCILKYKMGGGGKKIPATRHTKGSYLIPLIIIQEANRR